MMSPLAKLNIDNSPTLKALVDDLGTAIPQPLTPSADAITAALNKAVAVRGWLPPPTGAAPTMRIMCAT